MARGSLLWSLGFVLVGLSLVFARLRAFRLLRRIRFLLLTLVVLFAFFTPGEAVWPFLQRWGPSYEGVHLASLHGVRLVCVVMLVALLLENCSERALVAALLTLAAPLRCVGLSVERLAVRILLVLRYVEAPPVGGWRGLLGEQADSAAAESVAVDRRALALRDWLVLVAAGVALMIGAMW